MDSKTITQQVTKHYDDRIRQFSDEELALKEKRMKPLYEKVLEFARINSDATVGIVGSSTGSFPLFIAPFAKRVIGVDLSEESLNFAKRRTKQLSVSNIEYRKGDAEALPLKDNLLDIALSDCVINLVPNKQKSFEEIYRTLKPGGSLIIADPIRKKPFAEVTNESAGGCIAGTVAKEDYEEMLTRVGFDHIEVTDITDLAKKVFVGHEDKFAKYGLDYVVIKATKSNKFASKSTKEDILKRFDSHLGVSFPHRFEKPHIIKEIKSEDKVLDIGCGVGQTTLEFAEFIGSKDSITGIDFSPKRIEEARHLASASPYKERVQFRVEDAESLDFPDDSYTLIISQGVLLHLIQKEAAVKEMFRVLKPQGRVTISMVALKNGASLGWEKDMTGVPMEWLSISDYEKMFIRNGFKIDSRIDLSKEMRDVLAKASGRYAQAFSRVPKNWCYPLWKLVKPDIKQINKSGDEIREKVRENYGNIAQEGLGCGCSSSSHASSAVKNYTKKIGYQEKELSSVPEGANLGLGCGNPVALASLKEGDVVLDLGSGAGFDAFLAAQTVGKSGNVIGVDMTPEMIKKARENAEKGSYRNVEFRLGEIENLPVADNSIDVIISNCVINLSPDKERVFQEAYRVLRTGGRLMVSDIVLEKPLPPEINEDIEAYVGCIAGASLQQDYLNFIKEAEFQDVEIVGSANWTMEDNDIKDKIKQSKIGQFLLRKLGGNVRKIADVRRTIRSIKVSAVK